MLTRTITGPCGPFLIPGEPPVRTEHSEICVRHVFEGEYNYERPEVEDVHRIVDVGCNVGSFIVWACKEWWPDRIWTVEAFDPNPRACLLARVNVCDLEARVTVYSMAVSVDPAPLFKEHDDWGGSRTHNETTGVPVPAIHPRDLPACDVLKVDAEGVDADVFEHYQHWDGVQVAMFEYHEKSDYPRMRDVCERAGLREIRHHGSPPKQGICIYVRDPEMRYPVTPR